MKKLLLTSIMGICCASPLTVIAPTILTSCSDVTVSIDAIAKTKIISEKTFSIDFQISALTFHDIHISITNEQSGKLTIADVSFEPLKKIGSIQFTIDDSVHYNKNFEFSLEFEIRRGTVVKTVYVDDFKVYYVPVPEPTTDSIRIEKRSIQCVNSWEFVYTIQFSNMPLSSVDLEIRDESSGKLELLNDHVNVEKVGSSYFAYVPIHLDYSVFKTSIFPFGLEVDFTSSYGVYQREKIEDMLAIFVDEKTDELPIEYYDIAQQQSNGDTQYVLKGVKSGIPEDILSSYSTLVLPENITKINENAFDDVESFGNISKIIFNSKVETIGENAFAGCYDLKEFDISIFDNYSKFPSWLKQDTAVKLFNTCHSSIFVWVNEELTSTQIKDIQSVFTKKLGIETTPYIDSLINAIPEDFFYIEKDSLTGENVLISMNKTKISNVKNYKIIRIPDKVDRIGEYALSELSLSSNRYIKDNAYAPRVIVFNNHLSKIEGINACSYLGLEGPIILPPKIETIHENTFSYCTKYRDSDRGGTSLSDLLTIIDLYSCKQLKTIGNYAFAFNSLLDRFIGLPASLATNGNDVCIGEYILKSDTILNYIDLSPIRFKNEQEAQDLTANWSNNWLRDINSTTAVGGNGKIIADSNIHSFFKNKWYINKQSNDWTISAPSNI